MGRCGGGNFNFIFHFSFLQMSCVDWSSPLAFQAFTSFLVGLAFFVPGVILVSSNLTALALVITGALGILFSLATTIYMLCFQKPAAIEGQLIPPNPRAVNFIIVPANLPDTCVVCLEEKQVGSEIAMLSCAHSFHIACIQHWFHRNVNCPICRA